MTVRSIIYSIAIVLLWCVFGSHDTYAHATPITYKPAASAVVESLPPRITIHFSERIEKGASGIAVFAPNGNRIDNGAPIVNTEDAHFFGIGFDNAGEGTYTVSWQVVSADDGHFTKGAFSFSLGVVTKTAGTGGQTQIQHVTTLPQAITIGLELVGQALILAGALAFAFLWRPLRGRFAEDLDEKIWARRWTLLVITGAFFALLGVALFLIIKSFDLQQLRAENFFDSFRVFLGTVDGSYALARGMLALLFAAIFLFFRRRIIASNTLTWQEGVLWGIAGLMVLDRARVSHAAAAHFYPLFSITINFFHLAAKEVWAGGLFALVGVALPAILKRGIGAYAFLLALFSKYIAAAFGIAAVTGAYITWLHLKDPQYITATEWGSRFILLATMGGVWFALRLLHKFFVDPAAVAIAERKSTPSSERVFSLSRLLLPLEAFMGVIVLSVTALMIITTPPYPPEHFTFSRDTINQGVRLSLEVHPFEHDFFLITARDAKSGNEVSLDDMVITLTNEDRDIGPIVAEVVPRFNGGYVVPRSALSPDGIWKIGIAAQRVMAYDAVAEFTIDSSREIEVSRISGEVRPFGAFDIVIIIAGIATAGVALTLFKFSNGVAMRALREGAALDRERRGIDMRAWIGAGVGMSIVLILLFSAFRIFGQSAFERECKTNGHFWLQSAPMRDGIPLSKDTVTGCFLDVGLYHFADIREYRYFLQRQEVVAELSTPPQIITNVSTELTVSLSEVKNGVRIGPARDMGIYHDRIVHAIIVSEDLRSFAHVHTEDSGPISAEMRAESRFPIRYIFPKRGRYLINIDFVASGRERSQSFVVRAEGAETAEKIVQQSPMNGVTTREFGEYRVTLSSPKHIKTGERVKLKYYIEKNGVPVYDLEPYLGAAAHVALIRDDLGKFAHTHGEALQYGSVWFQQLFGTYAKYHMHFAPDRFGPRIITQPWTTVFPTAGIYRVFAEFKHKGKIVVTNFSLTIK